MPVFFTHYEYAVVDAACAMLIPTDDDPGATEARVVDYIDGLLGAFSFDPPRIWAGGPFSGRHGGAHGFVRFHRLTPLDELAWRTRIEGSRGRPEREINGPVVGLQERYRAGVAALGPDFAAVTDEERRARLERTPRSPPCPTSPPAEGSNAAPGTGGTQARGACAR